MQFTESRSAVSSPSRATPRARTLSQALFLIALAYALSALAVSHRFMPSDVALVFGAGAVPGLLVILWLRLTRPEAFARSTCLRLGVAALVVAALYAVVPFLVAA